jgi:chromosome segregation ATPase
VTSTQAADINRKLGQNKSDVEDAYDLLGKVEKQTAETNTKVDNLTSQVGSLTSKVDTLATDVDTLKTKMDNVTTDVADLRTDVGQLDNRVGQLDTRVGALETKVDTRFDQVDTRFDRLEALLISPRAAHDDPSNKDVLRTRLEKKVDGLAMRLEVYSGRTADHIDEIERHDSMFDAYDERFETQDKRFDAHEQRFDHLDSQMAEVLGILRDKAE